MERIVSKLDKLGDQMESLDHNVTRLSFIHESLSNFNESNGALLYGLMCNSWCVEFSSDQFNTDIIQEELKVVEEIKNKERAIAQIKSEISKLKPQPRKQNHQEQQQQQQQQQQKENRVAKPGISREGTRTSPSLNKKQLDTHRSSLLKTHRQKSSYGMDSDNRYQALEPVKYIPVAEDDTDGSFITNPDMSMIQPPTNVRSLTSSSSSLEGVKRGYSNRPFLYNNFNDAELQENSSVKKRSNRRKSTLLDSMKQKTVEEAYQYKDKRMSLVGGATRLSSMGAAQLQLQQQKLSNNHISNNFSTQQQQHHQRSDANNTGGRRRKLANSDMYASNSSGSRPPFR